MNLQYDTSTLQRARRSRDARFDGLFFIGVKTTGIYCRPICPANSPLEKNVTYFGTALAAAQAGFRPCLRCRPDSAPLSSAWLGTQTSFQRALRLIDEGALQQDSVAALAARLGMTDRYLRQLFSKNLGTSPKQYAVYQQCLFAKQLLHQSDMPIADVAFASGFNSVRRFNEAMQQQLALTPRDIRRIDPPARGQLQLKLHYRPPFDWLHMQRFLQNRMIDSLEWMDGDAYCRTVELGSTRGFIQVERDPNAHCLRLSLQLDDPRGINPVTQRVRRLFDLDAPIGEIDQQLGQVLAGQLKYAKGIRIPGIWSEFEAGVRAILGQQVSVLQAMRLVTQLVHSLGTEITLKEGVQRRLFPQPQQVADSDLEFLRMPAARKATLHGLAEYFLQHPDAENTDNWAQIKGIGPWTRDYAAMRGSKDPDIWLANDAGIKNALKLTREAVDLDACRPWRSYLTLQLWNQLSLQE